MSTPHDRWNPWKLTTLVMGVAIASALVTGLVVANWTGGTADRKTTGVERPAVESKAADARPSRPVTASAQASRPASAPQATASAPQATAASATPPPNAIELCNQYADQQANQQNKTAEVVKDGAVGALLGAAVGAAGGAIADGGKGAGKGAAIGGVVGAGAGTLYGLNENKKNDERYRDAYSACMRSRGYTS